MPKWRLEETAGWPGFFAFLVAGGLLAFGLIAGLSIGLVFLPLGMVLFGLLIAYAPDSRDRWGVFAGVGLVGVLIGILQPQLSAVPRGVDSGTTGRRLVLLRRVGCEAVAHHRATPHPCLAGGVSPAPALFLAEASLACQSPLRVSHFATGAVKVMAARGGSLILPALAGGVAPPQAETGWGATPTALLGSCFATAVWRKWSCGATPSEREAVPVSPHPSPPRGTPEAYPVTILMTS